MPSELEPGAQWKHRCKRQPCRVCRGTEGLWVLDSTKNHFGHLYVWLKLVGTNKAYHIRVERLRRTFTFLDPKRN